MAENIKDKCDELIKKIFGSNFYFVHGTLPEKIKPILKSGKLKISTHVNPKYWSWPGSKYAYCWVKYDDFKIKYDDAYYLNSFLIDPRILLHENIIFNGTWNKRPTQAENLTDTSTENFKEPFDPIHVFFSVYLNKDDSKEERLKKLEKIRTYIFFINSRKSSSTITYSISHEFLFPKSINLKKYLIGMIIGVPFLSSNEYRSINKILKREYKHVKIYENRLSLTKEEYFPDLLDIIC